MAVDDPVIPTLNGNGRARVQPAPQVAPRRDSELLRIALNGVADTSPDDHVKALKAADRLRVSPDAVTTALKTSTPAQRQSISTDYDDIARRGPLVRQFLLDHNNAAVLHDDIDGMIGLERSLRPLHEDRGFWGGLVASGASGFSQLEQGSNALNFIYGFEDADGFADSIVTLRREARESAARQPEFARQYQRRIDAASGIGVVPEFFSDPRGALYLTTEQLANMFPSLVLGAAGGASGAAAGSAVPVVGTVAGGLAGAATGVGAGSAAVEIGAFFIQALGEAGVNLDDKAAIAAALHNPDLVAEAQGKAERKGLTIGVVEGLSTVFGGRLIRKAGGGSIGKAKAVAREGAEQFAAESGGEALSQVAAYKGDLSKVDVKDVLLEGLSATGTSTGRVTLGTIFRGAKGLRATPVVKEAVKIVQATRDAQAVSEAAVALGKLKSFQRTPEVIKDFIRKATTGDGLTGVTHARIGREEFDAVVTAAGAEPVEVAATLGDNGPTLYAESANTGEVRIPIADYIGDLGQRDFFPALLGVTRFREDAPTAAEAGPDGEQLAADLEAVTRQATEEVAAVADLRAKVADLDARIAAAEPEADTTTLSQAEIPQEGAGAPVEPAVLRGVADAVEAATGQQATPEAVQSAVAAVTDAGTPEQQAFAAGVAQEATTDPVGVAARLRATADRQDADTARTVARAKVAELRTQRSALQAEIDAKVATAKDNRTEATRVRDEVREGLIAAGRPATEAALQAAFFVRILDVIAERYGMSLKALVARFPLAIGGKGEGATLEQTAFHGGPHRFDKFDIGKIGTGEGAQSFGWGLYFAGAKEVAAHYRHNLTPRDAILSALTEAENKSLPNWTKERIGAAGKPGLDEQRDTFIKRRANEVESRKTSLQPWLSDERIANFDNMLRLFDKIEASGNYEHTRATGAIYTVDLAPAEDEYLLWDKPLAEQSEKVKKALRSLVIGDSPQTDPSVFAEQVMDTRLTHVEGQVLYGSLAFRGKSEEAASKALLAAGVKGIKYLDQQSRTAGEGTYNYVLFDDKLVTITKVEQQDRGSLTFTDPDGSGRRLFNLAFLAGANRSTFFHEAIGHFAFEVLGDLAQDADAPQQIRDDYAGLLSHAGIKDRAEHVERQQKIAAIYKKARLAGREVTAAEKARLDKLAEPFETVARSFEGYLLEDKAPTPELRRVFATFARWFVKLYRDLAGLNVTLTDDVRDIFDRLVASDEELEAARADIESPLDLAGAFSPEEQAQYEADQQAALDEQQAAVNRDALADFTRERLALRRRRLDELRVEASAEVAEMPEVKALAALRAGTKIDRASAAAALSPGAVQRLDSLGVLTESGGVSVEDAALAHGFKNPADMLRGLSLAGAPALIVERIAQARLRERFPELLSQRDARQAARKALTGEAASRVLYDQLKALDRLARRAEKAERSDAAGDAARSLEAGIRRTALTLPTFKSLRDQAAAFLARKGLDSFTPYQFYAAARRESRLAAGRVRVGEYQQAGEAKRREILNHELFREATRLQDQAERDRAFMRKQGKAPAQDRVGKGDAGIRKVLAGLLEEVGLKRIESVTRIANRPTLAAWAAQYEQDVGVRPDIAPFVLAGALPHHSHMTAGQLSTTRAAVDTLVTLATNERMLRAAVRQMTFEQAKATLIENITASGPAIKGADKAPALPHQKATRAVSHFFGADIKVTTLIRQIDSFLKGGAAQEILNQPVNNAANAKEARMKRASKDWHDVLAHLPEFRDVDKLRVLPRLQNLKYVGPLIHPFTRRYAIDGVEDQVSHEHILGVAALWGSETGRQRVLNMHTAEEVQLILATLTKEDHAYLKALWQFFDDFWPEIAEKWERVQGVAPERIVTAGYDGPHGKLSGGYFPLRDRDFSIKEFDVDAQASLVRRAGTMFQMTKRGYGESRVATAHYIPRTDISVVSEHMAELVHDLTHHEMLLDLTALLGDRDVKAAIVGYLGETAYRQFTTWERDLAAAGFAYQSDAAKGLNWIRGNTAAALLSFKLLTGVKQFSGVGLTAHYLGDGNPVVGAKWVTLASSRWLRDAASLENTLTWIRAVDPFMDSRGQHFHRDIRKASEDAQAGGRTLWKELQYAAIERGQLAVDVVTWLAGYEKAMATLGQDLVGDAREQRAIEIASQTVRDTQGSAQTVDLAASLRGSAGLQLLTLFNFYGNLQRNLQYESVQRFRRGHGPARFASLILDNLMIIVVPAAITLALTQALRGKDDDDDEDKFTTDLLREALGDIAGTSPLTAQASAFIKSGVRYEGPAPLKIVPEGSKTIERAVSGDFDDVFLRHATMTAGMLSGLPASQINTTIDGFRAWEEGRANAAALLFGPPVGSR